MNSRGGGGIGRIGSYHDYHNHQNGGSSSMGKSKRHMGLRRSLLTPPPPPLLLLLLLQALERVRQGADTMPKRQLYSQLVNELGEDWRDKFTNFDESPIAAASIGQVHKAVLPDGRVVVLKIQYPGVAQSIDSDLSNLKTLVSMLNVLPPGE